MCAFHNVSHLAHPPFHGDHVLRLVQRQTDSGSFHAAGDECCHHACVPSACLQQDKRKNNNANLRSHSILSLLVGLLPLKRLADNTPEEGSVFCPD
jgi:hypothetical protein